MLRFFLSVQRLFVALQRFLITLKAVEQSALLKIGDGKIGVGFNGSIVAADRFVGLSQVFQCDAFFDECFPKAMRHIFFFARQAVQEKQQRMDEAKVKLQTAYTALHEVLFFPLLL